MRGCRRKITDDQRGDRVDGEVQVALWHRLEEWLPAGGHVEFDQHPAEAAQQPQPVSVIEKGLELSKVMGT
ncbi:hypothetical protein [Sphaerisporangium perillae]|uniref:hypothetical protein n=1 Tax=Sphaerisporangium perillae TaxID=2935860 RepID=UPI00200CA882|nr:hypothetical protein [Sphaerisporangium perillae]